MRPEGTTVSKLPKISPPQTALANRECKVGRLAAGN